MLHGFLHSALIGSLLILSFDEYSISFRSGELALIAFAFQSLEQRICSKALLYATFFSFTFNRQPGIMQSINTLVLFGYDIVNELWLAYTSIRENLQTVLRCAGIVMLCGMLQVALVNKRKNTKRKLFHIAGLFLFINTPTVLFRLAHLALYFFVCLAGTSIPQLIFGSFINDKDYGRGIFSHIFLLTAVAYPSVYLSGHKYALSLITITLMDSAASATGLLFGQNRKSWIGFVAGQVAAMLGEYVLFRNIEYKYHLAMGLIEMYSDINDNILLPISSVVYQSVIAV